MDILFESIMVILILTWVKNSVLASSGIYIVDLKSEDKPGMTNVTVDVKSIGDDQICSMNVTTFKRLNNQIMINFKLSKIEGKTMTKLFQAPKFNYCDMRRQGSFVPIVTDVLKTIEQYGNLIFKCPAEPGVYAIKDVYVNKLPIMSLISIGDYFLMAEMINENRRSRPELVMRFKVHISRK